MIMDFHMIILYMCIIYFGLFSLITFCYVIPTPTDSTPIQSPSVLCIFIFFKIFYFFFILTRVSLELCIGPWVKDDLPEHGQSTRGYTQVERHLLPCCITLFLGSENKCLLTQDREPMERKSKDNNRIQIDETMSFIRVTRLWVRGSLWDQKRFKDC